MQGPITGWLWLVTLEVNFDAKVLARFNNRDVGILLQNFNGTVLVVKSENRNRTAERFRSSNCLVEI
ncbi:hypothetical protein CMV_013621 [Castanea mollissima]|uniref:Uncharacterized protein n=1 Tax=Castanea mollissima TaxID=60419 RepID=A0A8J4QXP5_9ROSI|nr:hypothetical protein CMV_013621 [Castanea mollissima]